MNEADRIAKEEAKQAKKAEEQAKKEAEQKAKDDAKRQAEEAKQAKKSEEQAKKEAGQQARDATKSQAEEAKQAKKSEEQAKKEAERKAKEEAREAKRVAEQIKKDPDICLGYVELILSLPMPYRSMEEFTQRLNEIEGLRVVWNGGSVVEGTIIGVSSEEQIPLISNLKKLPQVEDARKSGKKVTVKIRETASSESAECEEALVLS